MATKKTPKKKATKRTIVEDTKRTKFAELLATRRWCYVIPSDGFVEGHGYRVSIAVENEKGHFPTGDDRAIVGDYSDGAKLPWFWGMTYKDAEDVCAAENARLGIDPDAAFSIVMSTMGGE